MKKIILPLLMMMCLVLSFPVKATESGVRVALPVEQRIKVLHVQPQKQSFEYVLKSLDASNPMPNDKEEYRFKLTGNESKLLDAISYVHAGIYSYELNMVTSEKVDGYTYDDKSYRIDIYVKNTKNGGLDPVVVVQHQDGKCGLVLYEHVYDKQEGTNTSTQTNSMHYVFLMVCAFFGMFVLFLYRNKEER